jgi:LCP family protein required for cell wall assembly
MSPRIRIGGRIAGALVSCALLLASGWAWYNFAALKRNTHVVHLPGLRAGAQRPSGIAQNILIVGYDTREGLTEEQIRELKVGNDKSYSTDTLMLVHVPADGSKATLISIPRDSWVHIPGFRDDKINAAFADGYYNSGAKGEKAQQKAGSSLLLTTVKQLTGEPIDHYVQVGFAGFVEIVGAIGKIPVTLCHDVDDTHAYNVAHNETGGSGFKMTAGHHDLTPKQALEFVRQRHNIPGKITDDLGRELRQRYFLSAAFNRVLSAHTLLDPFRLRKLVNAVTDTFTLDDHFELTEFADQMADLTAGNIVGRSIPTEGSLHVGDQVALRVDPAHVHQVVEDAFNPKPAPRRAPRAAGQPATSTGNGLSTPAKQSCIN